MDDLKTYKLGSLFDGSGGFPLAGALCGVEPVWASEVEPYPIAVTRARFPNMKHLGDISKINGAEIEPVDIITFGSPCQDLSMAGLRKGLKHTDNGDEETTRSGLFMEAVRIIKEMRKATNGEYPRFALWENVPGAFSSNKGEDFRIVCEELIKIVEPSASMPSVPQNGWSYADSYVGDGWSLAYRVFDAQYWGVPQRRRRIHLVADFRGECAREILFEREGLRGYFTEGRTPWQTTPADAQGGAGADDRSGEGFDGYNGELTGDRASTLGVNCGVSTGRNGVIERIRQLDDVALGFDRYNQCLTGEVIETLRTPGGGDNYPTVCYTMKVRSGCAVDSSGKAAGKGALIQKDKAATLSTVQDQYLFQPITDTHILDDQGGSVINVRKDGQPPTLRAQMGGHPPVVMVPAVIDPVVYAGAGITSPINATNPLPGDPCHTLSTDNRNLLVQPAPVICLQGNGIDRADTAGCNGKGWNDESCYTLNTIDRPAVVYAVDQGQNAKFDFSVTEESQPCLTAKGPGAVCCSAQEHHPRYIVRRLTPTECARLQGFADWWGRIEPKKTLTDEEHLFWMDVRNTHAAINGKKVQEYTKRQMLIWYNKLYTDSAEYKLWGNGIALPTALYCLQGITVALNRTEEADAWML